MTWQSSVDYARALQEGKALSSAPAHETPPTAEPAPLLLPRLRKIGTKVYELSLLVLLVITGTAVTVMWSIGTIVEYQLGNVPYALLLAVGAASPPFGLIAILVDRWQTRKRRVPRAGTDDAQVIQTAGRTA